MVKNNTFLIRYLQYFLKAKGANSIHSPFVFELYNKVITDNARFYDFGAIEKLREQLLYSKEVIETIDFGAGEGGAKIRKISEITKTTSIPASKGRILFRLVNHMQPKILVEMGTSLGISTLYLSKAVPDAKIVTMEGSQNIAKVAFKNFSILKARNIKLVTGKFGETLPLVIKELDKADFVFFDGNHRKEATFEYFKTFLPLASNKCVFVFDDIRWSDGMYEAWNEIIKEPNVTVSIDLFSFGIVFLNLQQAKEDFVLWKK